MSNVNGVGPKIVSLFLRDVAIYYGIAVTSLRDRLQPIDVHVRRITLSLMQVVGADDHVDAIAPWIVSESQAAGVSPELVNAGMWYFGSQIAGSEYRTLRALKDLPDARALVDKHVANLRQEASDWNVQYRNE